MKNNKITSEESERVICSHQGDKLVFVNPDGGYPGECINAQKHLKVGQTYTISEIHIGQSHTSIYFKSDRWMPFNSCHFVTEADYPAWKAREDSDESDEEKEEDYNYNDKLTFADIKVGDYFIDFPTPGDNHGHGGYKAAAVLHKKIKPVFKKGHRGNAVDDRGVKSIIPDIMEVEKIVGVTGFFKEKK